MGQVQHLESRSRCCSSTSKSLTGTGRERTCCLFPQSLPTATGLFPTTSIYFLSPPSRYDVHRVEKLRHQAILLYLMKSWKVSSHCSTCTYTWLILGTSGPLLIPLHVRRSKNKCSTWECMSLVLHNRAKRSALLWKVVRAEGNRRKEHCFPPSPQQFAVPFTQGSLHQSLTLFKVMQLYNKESKDAHTWIHTLTTPTTQDVKCPNTLLSPGICWA